MDEPISPAPNSPIQQQQQLRLTENQHETENSRTLVTTSRDLTLHNTHSTSTTNVNRNLLKRPADDDIEMTDTQAESSTNTRPRITGPPTPPTLPALPPAAENLMLEAPPTETDDSFSQIEIFEVDNDDDVVFTGDVPEAEFYAALSRQAHVSRSTRNPNPNYADSNSNSEILLITPTTYLGSEPSQQQPNRNVLMINDIHTDAPNEIHKIPFNKPIAIFGDPKIFAIWKTSTYNSNLQVLPSGKKAIGAR